MPPACAHVRRDDWKIVSHKVDRLLSALQRHITYKVRAEWRTHLHVTDRPTITTRPSDSLHLNNSYILFSTFLLTDPEVFLMLLHNSVWCCIATVQVSLYVTGEGDFSKRRTGGSDWWYWCQCFSFGCVAWLRSSSEGGRRVWQTSDGLMDIWMNDW